jgi:hypothetical protein
MYSAQHALIVNGAQCPPNEQRCVAAVVFGVLRVHDGIVTVKQGSGINELIMQGGLTLFDALIITANFPHGNES